MEFIINFSGGKDSCAMLAYICKKYPQAKKHVIFADTGWEHKDAEQWCRGIVSMFGLELIVVRNKNKTFLSMVENRKKFPGMQQRQCTSDLKRGPIQTWIRQNFSGKPRPCLINCMGLRSDESAARGKKKKFEKSSMTNSKRLVFEWLPIQNWTEDNVFDFLKTNGIPLHPVYAYLRRFSCRICIYMNKHDLGNVRINDPEAISIIADIEKRIGFTMFNGTSIEDISNY